MVVCRPAEASSKHPSVPPSRKFVKVAVPRRSPVDERDAYGTRPPRINNGDDAVVEAVVSFDDEYEDPINRREPIILLDAVTAPFVFESSSSSIVVIESTILFFFFFIFGDGVGMKSDSLNTQSEELKSS